MKQKKAVVVLYSLDVTVWLPSSRTTLGCCLNSLLLQENTVTYLPFYGGAKGQMLVITESPNGTVMTNIISANATRIKENSQFSSNIQSIHASAQNIIKLQEAAKKNGHLNDDEQSEYNLNMEQLNLSSKSLAELQMNDENIPRTNLRFWFDRKKEKYLFKKNEEEQEGNEETENEKEDTDDDGVSINLPPDDASVAEAKPVGLAVAGVGGVAASKPIATAVVGPGGLAIARPVATAIAGISPEEAMLPIFEDGFIKFPPKRKEKPSKEESHKEKAEKKKEKEEKKKLDEIMRFADGYALNFD